MGVCYYMKIITVHLISKIKRRIETKGIGGCRGKGKRRGRSGITQAQKGKAIYLRSYS